MLPKIVTIMDFIDAPKRQIVPMASVVKSVGTPVFLSALKFFDGLLNVIKHLFPVQCPIYSRFRSKLG